MELNFSLHPAQMEVFKADKKFSVVVAGRRFGKSYMSAIKCLVEGIKETNDKGYDLRHKDVWYIAPTFQQGKDIMWGLLKDLGKDIIESTVENTATIRLINGRRILIKGSDRPDTLRGAGLGFAVLDEYASMRANVWEEIILPTLTDVEGGALFIGTPAGKNHFYDLYKESEADDSGDWGSWHFNTTDNPTLNKKLVETFKKKMSTHAFKQEFEASFEATGSGIFKDEWIQIDTQEPPDGQWYIAVDPAGYTDDKEISKGKAKNLDETAIAVVKVGPYGWWVKEIDSGRWGVRETSIRILHHYKQVRAAAVGIEQGSLKNAIMPYLEDQMRRLNVFPRIESVTHGNQKKTERIAWALAGRFEHGRVKLNEGAYLSKFRAQLLDFPNPLAHDDLPDALAYIAQISETTYLDEFEIDYWEALDPDAGY